jgi:hypothetical protein
LSVFVFQTIAASFSVSYYISDTNTLAPRSHTLFCSATDFLMDSPRRSRFLVSVEAAYPRASFVPVLACSDDVPRMHLLAELPPLASVAAGAIAGLFTRKLELCCLQVRHFVWVGVQVDTYSCCRVFWCGVEVFYFTLFFPCSSTFR